MTASGIDILERPGVVRDTLGRAFLEAVIRDPGVQTTGAGLCSVCPLFKPLFEQGLFPVQVGLRKFRGFHREIPVNLCRPLATVHRHQPSNQPSLPPIPTVDHPPNLVRWEARWPVVLDPAQLRETLTAENETNRRWWRHPFGELIGEAASLLVTAHESFFAHYRAGALAARGLHRNSGQVANAPAETWARSDRFLDLRTGDLLESAGGELRVLWESLTSPQKPEPRALRGRPADQTLERQLAKIGLADGRHGKTDQEIASALVDRSLTGQQLYQAIDRKRQQIKRFYQRRSLT